MRKFPLLLLSGHVVAVFALLCTSSVVGADRPVVPSMSMVVGHASMDRIAPWRSRFGRSRPVVAIIGNNSGTELVDFVIPYAVLMASDAADVVTVATQPGPITMRPALKLQPQTNTHDFNTQYADGADYVIVPAVVDRDDPRLLGWIAGQYRRGATVVSICDGALVVANAGISAAMPTSLALVEAIAGHARAAAVAEQLGVADWSPRHDSDAFQPRFG